MKLQKTYVYTAQRSSKSALDLAKQLRIKRIKTGNSRFKAGINKTVINWGVSEDNFNLSPLKRVVNNPSLVKIASNKLLFFQRLLDISEENRPRVPDWTTSKAEAQKWIVKSAVVARRVLTGHSGAGIVICDGDEDVADAPLYTKYIKKAEEYRVHYFRGNESNPFIQRKVRVLEVENPNWRIRNLSGGFRYASSTENVGSVPPDVLTQSAKAFRATDLDFCCVDVLWNESGNNATVLECNTAPGLVGRTLEYYKDNMIKLLERS